MPSPTPESIPGLLDLHANAIPDDPAVIYNDQPVSFAELDLCSRRVALVMQEMGLVAGDRVALWLPNTVAYLVLFLACARLSVIAVAVNSRYKSLEVADILHRSRARVLVMWPGFRNIDFHGILAAIDAKALRSLEQVFVYEEVANNVPLPGNLDHCCVSRYVDLVDQAMPALATTTVDSAAGCKIFTTSGTTSAPKFVLHSQQDLLAHARDVHARLREGNVAGAQLLALPLCGVFGFTQAMMSLYAGSTSVIMNAFDAAHAIDLINRYRVSYLNATDDMIEALLQADTRAHAIPSIQHCGYGAFNSDPEVIVNKAAARNLKLVGLYGMSEVQALFAMQPFEASIEQRTPGGGVLVSPAANVRTRNIETGEVAAHGEQGELEIRGPSLMQEYFENPAATEQSFTADGYLRTGDLGYTTSENSFIYLARMGDALRLGGFLVSPVEIEVWIQSIDWVVTSQVVAVNVEGRMQAVAFVICDTQSNFDEQHIINHCRGALASYKVPVRVFDLVEYPVTHGPNGTKIQRAKLREWATEWVVGERPDNSEERA